MQPVPLFRPEVVERRRRRLHGEVRLDACLSSWAITLLLVSIVAGAVALLSLASYARTETVLGWLKPDTGIVRVTAPVAGVVAAVPVGEGETVEAGAPLFTLSRDFALPGGGLAGVRLEDQIVRERLELEERLKLVAHRFAAERERARARLASLEAERATLQRQVETQARRVLLAADELERIGPLVEKGTISRREGQRREEALLARTMERERLEGRLATNAADIAEAEARFGSLPIDEAARKAELRERLAGLDQRATRTSRERMIVVRAPVAGRVAAVTAKPGEAVEAGAMQVSILPAGGTIEAELFVPTRAAGFLATGQPVTLRYDAFPYQKFDTGKGRVVAISHTVLDPRDLPAGAPRPAEPFFRVVATLSGDAVVAYGTRFPLQPGMTLSATIVLERRTLVELLFDPLFAAVGR